MPSLSTFMSNLRFSPAPALPLLPLLFALAACQPGPAATPSAGAAAASPAAPPLSSNSDPIARGEYLVRLGGCNDCHTPGYAENGGNLPKSEWLQGSPLGYSGPWGTTYPTNLRLSIGKMSEQDWLTYSANLRTRPLMPDFTLRAMAEADRRAIYRFIHSLGPAGEPAPQALPPGQQPPAPYLALVLPPAPTAAPAAAKAP